jgi:sugar (pentulose or hexulose) kinase
MSRKRSGPGAVWQMVRRVIRSVLAGLRRLVQAVRHVGTGGQTTRTAAVRRAARPVRCSACHQPIPQSDDWRDHLATNHPEWT